MPVGFAVEADELEKQVDSVDIDRVEVSKPKFVLGKTVCINVPRSIGPPLSEFAGRKGVVKGIERSGAGNLYKIIINDYIGEDDMQTVEGIHEEWLIRAGLVAESEEVEYLSLIEVLEACEAYKVPTFQRRYCWMDFQFKLLWKDVLKVRDNPDLNNHSFNRLMILKCKDGSRLVLDGQQRLTTSQLLLSALCDRMSALSGSDTELREYCREGRWMPTMYDRPDFRQCLRERFPSGDSSVIRAKRCFSELSEDLNASECEKTLQAVLHRLSMTCFVVHNEDGVQSVFEKMAMRTKVAEEHSVDLYSCIDCYSRGEGGKETKSTHWGPDGERLCQDCAAARPGSIPMTPGVPMSPVDLVRNFVFDHYAGDDAMKTAYETYWGPIELKAGVNSGLDTEVFEGSLASFLEARGFDVHNRWGIVNSFQRWWGKSDMDGPEDHANTKLAELLDCITTSTATTATAGCRCSN